MNNRKFFMLAVLTVLISFCAVAQDNYYVCVSSFTKEENARNLESVLNANSYSSFCQPVEKEDTIFYRLFINKPCASEDEARQLRDSLSKDPFFISMNINGDLWICQVPVIYKDNTVEMAVESVTEYLQQKNNNAERKTETPPKPEYKTKATAFERAEPETVVVEEEPELKETEEPELEVQLQSEEPADEIIQLAANNTNEIPVNEFNPFSVLVNTYAQEYQAESGKQKLLNQNINAFIVKVWDASKLFVFELHAGAFENEEAAEELLDKLHELGIDVIGVADFNEYSDLLKEYDELISEVEVVLDQGQKEFSSVISKEVQTNLLQLPVNRNFEIKQMAVCDLNNIRSNPESISEYCDLDDTFSELTFLNSATACSIATYYDDLFGNEVNVIILTQDPSFETATPEMIENVENSLNAKIDFRTFMQLMEVYDEDAEYEEVDFNIPYGVLHSYIIVNDTSCLIIGSTEDCSVGMTILANNMTKEQAVEFLNKADRDSSVLTYPQIRKNLNTLPENYRDSKFLSFVLEQVPESYAENKGYADWAYGIVGHWKTETWFESRNEYYNVSFFDLDYDYNANKIYKMFMDSHDNSDIPSNHGIKIHGTDGWYIENWGSKEVSFSNKSYIVAIDTLDDFDIYESDMCDIAESLLIW